eukprot:270916_1
MMDIGEGAEGDDEWECPGTVKTKEQKEAEAKAEEKDEDEDDWGEDDDDEKVTDKKDGKETRSYDLTVVYDEYYRGPRVYLFGYAANQPLAKEAMMEDVYSENREKTVTVDPHPYMKVPCISIHSC